MKIGAIIAEFNPFHSGHRFLIDNILKSCDAVVAIMSGNFVQRGECAVFSKNLRTKAALLNGVDLVVELPCLYALSSAEGFSKGAVNILEGMGIIDSLYFGSECGDIDALSRVACMLNDESAIFKDALQKKLKEGYSFPAARLHAIEKTGLSGEILNMPNNTLAIEYIREIKRISSPIHVRTVKRIGTGYNDTHVNGSVASASALRLMLREGKSIEKYSPFSVSDRAVFMEQFDSIVAARLKTISEEELCALPDCNQVISARLKEASKFNSFSKITEAASCKNYTQSRLRRILCNMLIGNTFSYLPPVEYIRPLGFTKKGSEILRKMKSTASLEIVARSAFLKDNPVFALECRSTDIYNLALNIEGGMEYSFSPLFIDSL